MDGTPTLPASTGEKRDGQQLEEGQGPRHGGKAFRRDVMKESWQWRKVEVTTLTSQMLPGVGLSPKVAKQGAFRH